MSDKWADDGCRYDLRGPCVGTRKAITWLGVINFLIVQWLFVRIARVTDGAHRTIGWGFIGAVWPLTGWWGRYRVLGRRMWNRILWIGVSDEHR